MTESMIYWITRLDGIHGFCSGFQIIASILAVIGILTALSAGGVKVVATVEGSDDEARIAGSICKVAFRVCIPMFCLATICSLARTFMPTTKEMIAIKVIPQIANVNNVEKIKDISKDMLDITADRLKDMRKKYVNGQDK